MGHKKRVRINLYTAVFLLLGIGFIMGYMVSNPSITGGTIVDGDEWDEPYEEEIYYEDEMPPAGEPPEGMFYEEEMPYEDEVSYEEEMPYEDEIYYEDEMPPDGEPPEGMFYEEEMPYEDEYPIAEPEPEPAQSCDWSNPCDDCDGDIYDGPNDPCACSGDCSQPEPMPAEWCEDGSCDNPETETDCPGGDCQVATGPNDGEIGGPNDGELGAAVVYGGTDLSLPNASLVDILILIIVSVILYKQIRHQKKGL